MRNTLICTVGTSLLGNFSRADEKFKEALNDQNWQQLSLLLLECENSDRLCGAEINSITSICNANLMAAKKKLIFLVSDTQDGKKIGQLLKLYYENAKNPIRFESVEVRPLVGLRDDDVKAFRREGLKNLVREISEITKTSLPPAIAINATGGYKAQISFAGMIGQALGIPVYYLFEKFSEVIELPPQPIALDLAFWLNNYLFFEQLEADQIVKKSAVEMDDNSLFDSFIEEEKTKEGEEIITLSAMGELFHERCRLEFAKQETTLLRLIPVDDTDPEKKSIKLADHHGKDVLLDFAKKIRHSPYVKKIVNSIDHNSKRTHPIQKTTKDGIVEFILVWTEKGYGLCIQTTGRNLAETNSIALHLQKEFSRG
ncbi:MAG: putative CRISPR-associated protein [Leptolyngbyaceae cyanobacterium CSU_1_3]|nr:putative CRISPR-associated protein [Leptolyngbyaceae cyanobacterium CSU_1_3]